MQPIEIPIGEKRIFYMGSSWQIEREKKQLDGGKNRETPRPVGAHNLATIARGRGNLIMGVGIKSTLLRNTMTGKMRCVRRER
jgi:hypothetical protein